MTAPDNHDRDRTAILKGRIDAETMKEKNGKGARTVQLEGHYFILERETRVKREDRVRKRN